MVGASPNRFAGVFKDCVTNNINKYMTAIVALKRAMVINSRIENPFMTGVIMERISELKRRMQKEVVEIEFRKKDGSITRRFATTMGSLAKQHINGRGISGDDRNVVTFWDCEKSAWRCFQIQSLVKVY
jgi:hypothetical protein